jgi:hypothetical protein
MNRNPLVTVLMVIFGLILLLPGLCAVVTAVSMVQRMSNSDLVGMGLLWAVCLAISFGGIMLLRKAFT